MLSSELRTPLMASLCTSICVLLGVVIAPTRADDWPDWRGPQRDGVWRESGVVQRFDGQALDVVWRTSIGSGYCGPTVADGRVYLTDRQIKPKQVERVHCFDAKTGRNIWTHTYDCPYENVSYDAGPRASVIIHDGRAYSLGTMGHFCCVDAASGKIHWQKDLKDEYDIAMPIWGIACAPLIYKDLVILQIGGADGACMVALDRISGKERWRALDDRASYSAPKIIKQAGRDVVVVYTGDHVAGLEPASGKVHWKVPFPPKRMVIGVADPVLHGDYLFVTNFFDGAMLLKLRHDKPAVEKVWHRAGESEKKTDALHSIISTPYLKGDHIYGVDSYGEFRCLELMTGDRVWESDAVVPRARWATVHIIEQGDQVWMFNEKGELIIADLSPKGYRETSRAKLIEPTRDQLPSRRGGVCWSHPAFADRHVFARNDEILVCASLSASKDTAP